jgi:hypothetical protein
VCLAKLSLEDFVTLFKATKGAERSRLVFGCLEFRKFTNATPRQEGIAKNAIAALEKIGNESALNAHRMKMFNISIEGGGE